MQVSILCRTPSITVLDYRCSAAPGDKASVEAFPAHCVSYVRKAFLSIHREISIDAPPEQVWSALRDVGALHTRVAPGFVTDTKLEEGARVVTFGNGMVARELIVDVDVPHAASPGRAVGTRMTHHNASFQVFAEQGRTRGVWIADLLPHEMAPGVTAMIEQGLAAMKRTMEDAAAAKLR